MDDLSGLDWSSSSSTNTNKKPTIAASSGAFASNAFSSYPSIRPTPSPLVSGRNTPLSAQGSGANTASTGAASKPIGTSKAAQDSFSGLISFGTAKATANLSLRERQELLEAEKRKKEEEKRKQQQANYGANGQFFDVLARGSAGPSRTASPAMLPPPTSTTPLSQNGKKSGDDDLFSAFSAETKVDNASYYPPPVSNGSGKSTPAHVLSPGLDLSDPSAWKRPAETSSRNNTGVNNDDYDPFGLDQLQVKNATKSASAPTADLGGDEQDDDLLGALSRPVEEFRRKAEAEKKQTRQQSRRPEPEPGKPIETPDSDSDEAANDGVAPTGNEAFDSAVAQLIDYGFTPENARRGLTESGGGLDVQAAVNWLLDDAHRQAKEKAKGKQGGGGGGGASRPQQEGRSSGHNIINGPAWMREGETPHRGGSPSSHTDGDFTKTAAAMGTTFLKTANSLWKTGQKRVQKAVQEFQQEGDPSQPKWMQSVRLEQEVYPAEADNRRRAGAIAAANATDEALMLESGARPERRPAQSRFREDSQNSSRAQSPADRFSSAPPGRNSPVPKWQQSSSDPKSRLTKQAIEEESAQVYVSPARRRKAATPSPAPASKPSPEPRVAEGDLLSNSTALPVLPAKRPAAAAGQQSKGGASARPTPRPTPSPRPSARPPRQVPQVNSFVLKASAKHRADGTAHFKRGDYAAAHASYSASLTDIPRAHPLLAVLFCNRALTALKTGEPRQAVADADSALAIIGPGKGEGETVSLQDGTDETRDMKDLYGKALTRKAEALEQMEKWNDAMPVWQQCVEDGIGGATAIAGRQRCQKALAPKPKAAPARPAAASRPAARPRPTTTSDGRDSDAVKRLRAANQAAEKEDAEKLALIDQVDAKIASWRDGKKDNLRALLGSLDTVMWADSGWKKVGLHELVMPNKVKIIYMKAIAKTHPDKLPQDASTEVRMIAGTVFATLNEGWDKFKADNKM